MATAAYMRASSAPPEFRTLLRQRELARRIASGASAKAAAALEGSAETVVEKLMAEPAFQGMVDAYERLAQEPDEVVLPLLSRLCRGVLYRHVAEQQDAAVAAWLLYTVEQGENPFRSLAERVWTGLRRSLGCTSDPESRPTRTRPEDSFVAHVDRMMSRIGGRLRKAVHREIAAQALVAHIDGKPLPENAVDAVIAVIDPPKAPKPRLLSGPIPPKLPTRRLPRRVNRRDGDDEALTTVLATLEPAEAEVLFGTKARAGPRAGPD